MPKLTLAVLLITCSTFFLPAEARVSLPVAFAQQSGATLHSRVVDARTGEPIAKVKVIVSGTQQNTTTDERGAFTLKDLQPGEVELYVSAVGYGIVKKTMALKEGENTEKDIALNQEAAALTEEITITATPFEETETNAPSEQRLNKSELQMIAMVLIGDPLRASQALPGVVANNDLRSDLAVRGASIDRIGIYIDGILAESLVHRLIESDTTDELSLSIINQDTISEVSLMSGAFPAKYGDSTAAVLKLGTREGNRVRTTGRIATGLLTTSGVVDGPIQNGRGSWLAAGRSSYIDYLQRLVERITGTGRSETDQDEDFNLNFSDAQSKIVYDVTPRHQLGVSGIFGFFKGDQGDANRILHQGDPDEIDRSKSRNLFVNTHWNYTPSARLFAQTRFFVLQTDYKNTNVDNLFLDDKVRTQFGVRNDISFLAPNPCREADQLFCDPSTNDASGSGVL